MDLRYTEKKDIASCTTKTGISPKDTNNGKEDGLNLNIGLKDLYSLPH